MKNSLFRITVLFTIILTMMTSMVSYAASGSYTDPMNTEPIDKDLAVRTDVTLTPSNDTNTYEENDDLDITFSINHIGKGDNGGMGENKDLLLAVYEDEIAEDSLVYHSTQLKFKKIHKVHLTTDAALEFTFEDVLSEVDVTPGEEKKLLFKVFDYGIFGNGWQHTEVDCGEIILNIVANTHEVKFDATIYVTDDEGATTSKKSSAGKVVFEYEDGTEIGESSGDHFFEDIEEDTRLVFRAVPEDGYEFYSWKYNLNNNLTTDDSNYRYNPRTDFVVDGSDNTINASPVFVEKTYSVKAESNMDGIVEFSGTGDDFAYEDAYGVSFTYKDDNEDLYIFDGWFDKGTDNEVDPDGTITEDVELEARFTKANLWVATDDTAKVYLNGVDADEIDNDHSGAWKDAKMYFVDVNDDPFIAAEGRDTSGTANIAGFRLVFGNSDSSYINTDSTWWVYEGGNDNKTINRPEDWTYDGETYDWNDPDYAGDGWVEATVITNPGGKWATDGDFPDGSDSVWIWSDDYDVPVSDRIDTPVYLRNEAPRALYNVAVSTQGDDGNAAVSVNGGDEVTVADGDEVTLTADTPDHYNFLGWYDGNTEITDPSAYEVTADKELVAKYELKEYDITATPSPEAGGDVDGAGDYAFGTTAELSAEPATGYEFVGWGIGDADPTMTDERVEVTVTGAADYTAYFELKEHSVTVSATDGGSADVDGQSSVTEPYGTRVTVTAHEADTGYKFVAWVEVLGDGSTTTVTTDMTFTTTATYDQVYQAVYTSLETYSVSVIIDDDDADDLTAVPSVQTVYENGTATAGVTEESSYTSVTALEVYELSGPADSRTRTLVETVTDSLSVTLTDVHADYEIHVESETVYPVTTASNDRAMGSTSPGSTEAAEGDEVTVTAAATDGHRFLGWYEEVGGDTGELVSEEASVTLTVTEPISLIAVFEAIPEYTVSYDSDGGTPTPDTETVTEGGTATEPTETVTREQDTFLGWFEVTGEDTLAEEAFDFDTAIEADMTLMADWEEYVEEEETVTTSSSSRSSTKTYDLDVEIEGEGSVSGDGEYDDGDTATLTAKPAEGYAFDRWIGADDNGEVVMDDDKTVTAVFVAIAEDLGDEAETVVPEAIGNSDDDAIEVTEEVASTILDMPNPEATPAEIPDQPLPQTGGVPVSLYTAAGLALSGIGLKLRKRR